MPTYEYECKKCGAVFEEFQNITAEPLKKCPQAGCRGTVKRLIGAGGGLLFKGSGFYITDYRSDSYKKAEKAAESPSTPASKETSDNSGKDSKGKSKEKKKTSTAAKD